jgi:hypothetical protein
MSETRPVFKYLKFGVISSIERKARFIRIRYLAFSFSFVHPLSSIHPHDFENNLVDEVMPLHL